MDRFALHVLFLIALLGAVGCFRSGFEPFLTSADAGSDGSGIQEIGPEDGGYPAWTALTLPSGGYTYGLARQRLDPEKIWVLASYARAFLSTDSGATWTECGRQDQSVNAIEAAPDADVVYLATDGDVLRSSDSCATWESTDLNRPADCLKAFSAGRVLAGTEDGLWLYADGAWQPLSTPLDQHTITSIRGDNSENRILVGSKDAGMARSVDGGASWSTVNQGFDGSRIWDLFLHPSNPLLSFAGSASGAFRTRDGGDLWTRIRTNSPYYVVAADPQDPNFVLTQTPDPLLLSTDGGDSFLNGDRRGVAMDLGRVTSLDFDPRQPGRLYASTYRGVFSLTDAQVLPWKWEEIDSGLNAWGINAIALNPQDGMVFLASPSGVLRSNDDGATWKVEIQGFTRLAWTQNVTIDPDDPQVVFAATEGLMRSTDAGKTYRKETFVPEQVDSWVISCVAPLRPHIYAGTGGRFLHSPDDGSSWVAVQVAGDYRRIREVLIVDRATPLLVVATASGIYSTVDHGASFTTLNEGLGSLNVLTLAKTGDGIVLAGTDQGVFAGDIGAGTWRPFGLEGISVNDLVVHGERIVAGCQDGVYLRDPDGDWRRHPYDLKGKGARSLAVYPDGRLLVGTPADGLFSTTLP